MKQSSFILSLYILGLSFLGIIGVDSTPQTSSNPYGSDNVTQAQKLDLEDCEISIPKRLSRTDTIKATSVLTSLRVPIHSYYHEYVGSGFQTQISSYNVSLDKWELDKQHSIISKQRRLEFKLGIGPGLIYAPFAQRFTLGWGFFYGLINKF